MARIRSRRGSTLESPTMSSLMASMFVEELRSLCRVLGSISLELSDGLASSTVE